MDILCKADIPAGALLSVDDITNDPQYYERGMMVEIDHPQRGKVKLPGFAPSMSAVRNWAEATKRFMAVFLV